MINVYSTCLVTPVGRPANSGLSFRMLPFYVISGCILFEKVPDVASHLVTYILYKNPKHPDCGLSQLRVSYDMCALPSTPNLAVILAPWPWPWPCPPRYHDVSLPWTLVRADTSPQLKSLVPCCPLCSLLPFISLDNDTPVSIYLYSEYWDITADITVTI